MAASLNKLKGFIQTYLGYNFENLKLAETEEIKIFVCEALNAVRWEIEAEFAEDPDERRKNQYIGSIQSQLSYLLEGLNGVVIEEQQRDVPAPIIEWAAIEIHKLLEHLKTYFSAHFDSKAKLPAGFIEGYKSRNKALWDELTDKIGTTNFDNELKLLIKNFYEASSDSKKFVLKTWEQLDYQVFALHMIARFFDHPAEADLDLEILKLFVGIDFNSIQVYAYFIKYIERTTLGDGSFQQQQEELLYLLKVFKQVRIDATAPYDPKVQSLKLSVVESLDAELAYIEKKEKLYLQNFKITNPNSPSKFYFTVAVTLAELMFFFRVMLEVKVIYTKFNSYLYEFIANHIRTERAENISKKSMRNHFSNKPFPDRVVQNVKAWLEKMIQHINLYYGM